MDLNLPKRMIDLPGKLNDWKNKRGKTYYNSPEPPGKTIEERVKLLEGKIEFLEGYTEDMADVLGYLNQENNEQKAAISQQSDLINQQSNSIQQLTNSLANLNGLYNNHSHSYFSFNANVGIVVDYYQVGNPVLVPGGSKSSSNTSKPV